VKPALFFTDKVKPRKLLPLGQGIIGFFILINPYCQKPLVDGNVPLLLVQPMIIGGKSGASIFLMH